MNVFEKSKLVHLNKDDTNDPLVYSIFDHKNLVARR